MEKEEKPFVLGDDTKQSEKEGEHNEEGKPLDLPISKEQMELQKKAKEYLAAKSGGEDEIVPNVSEQSDAAEKDENTKKKPRKRKRTKEFDDDSSEESSEDEAEDDVPPGMDKSDAEKKDVDDDTNNIDSEGALENTEEMKGQECPKLEPKEEEGVNNDSEKSNGTEAEVKTENDLVPKLEEIDGNQPRPLHKVTSIFLRNLSPTITKQEVEAMCRRYPGFLRAAIADPSPDRRWFRRGWVTFERDIKIKDICFNLNNIRLRLVRNFYKYQNYTY